MPLFPKISSPCPYKSDLAAVMDGDHCRMCDRQVCDLTAMSDEGRLAFLAACRDEVCVSYSIPLRRTVRAAALAAAIAIPGATAARPARTPPSVIQPPVMVIAGGIAPPPQVQVVEVPAEASPADVRSLYDEPAAGGQRAPQDAPARNLPERPRPASGQPAR